MKVPPKNRRSRLAQRATRLLLAQGQLPKRSPISRGLRLESLEVRHLLASLPIGTADYLPGELIVGFDAEFAAHAKQAGLSGAFHSAARSFDAVGLERSEILSDRGAPHSFEKLRARFTLQAGKDAGRSTKVVGLGESDSR